jgi:hypothetical protein
LAEVIIHIKRVAPTGPGRGTIVLSPGNATEGGTWVATELPHQGDAIFPAERGGKYSIAGTIVTMKNSHSETLVVINSWEGKALDAGPGQTFKHDDGQPMNIAWNRVQWPIDI